MPDLRDDVQALGVDGVTALLGAVPCLGDAVAGRGPLAPSWPFTLGTPRPLGRDGFVRLLATPPAAEFLALSLDAQTLALAQLAAWHGGTLTREQAQAEAPQLDAAELDELAEVLRHRLLSDPDRGWVALRPAVVRVVDLPGHPAQPALRHVLSDTLAEMLRMLGRPVPSRKTERLAAVVAALRDPDMIERTVSGLPAAAARAFALLVRHGPQRVADLGEPHWPPFGLRARDSAIGELMRRGLAGVDTEQQVCFLWLDTLVGLRGGRLFGDAFPTAVQPQTVGLPGGQPALPPVLEHLDALLAHWRARPADALSGGGLGVRPVRAAAKALGMPGPEAGLLATLAAEIGLLGVVDVGSSGRGRNRKVHRQWAPTALADVWSEQSPAWRWALLVDTWRHTPRVSELDGLPERHEPHSVRHDATAVATRSAWLLWLASLPHGRGVDEGDVARAAGAHCPQLLGAPGRVDAMLAASRVLGLVPVTGAVGLTAAARAVLDGPEAVDALLPTPADEIVVQADHTVIVPPDAASDVTATLARWAELETSAGARVYRLSERRIAAALAAGEDDGEMLGWIKEHSRVGVPQNVEYLIRDVARRRGRVRAGTASAYLRSDDAALITRAVSVRSAKLRLLAPTVAVSSLSRAKLLAALADAGVAAVAEDADGVTVELTPPDAERVGWHHSAEGLPALHRVPPPAELAERLTAGGRQRAFDDPDDPIERLKRRERTLGDAPDDGDERLW